MRSTIESAVKATVGRYRLHQAGLKVAVQSVTERQTPSMSGVEKRINDATRYGADEQRRGVSYDVQLMLTKVRALFERELSDALLQMIESERGVYGDNLEAQYHRDRGEAVKFARRFMIETERLAQLNGWTRSYAAVTLRESRRLPNEGYLDRAGRRWKAEWYIEVLARTFYTDLFNEIARNLLLEKGETTGRIVSNTGRYDGATIALTPDTQADFSYQEARTKIFHPNGSSLLYPVGKSV